jgi:hypothetical protein
MSRGVNPLWRSCIRGPKLTVTPMRLVRVKRGVVLIHSLSFAGRDVGRTIRQLVPIPLNPANGIMLFKLFDYGVAVGYFLQVPAGKVRIYSPREAVVLLGGTYPDSELLKTKYPVRQRLLVFQNAMIWAIQSPQVGER